MQSIKDRLRTGMELDAKVLRDRARRGLCTGLANSRRESLYMQRCRAIDDESASQVIFTRDTGHHSSGWLKNPDFERCWHLSISPLPADWQRGLILTDDWAWVVRTWCEVFFGDDKRYTWIESAKSAVGVRAGVVHYRLFCDPAWKPIMPRGEVYDRTHTPTDWRSWSELHGSDDPALYPSHLNAE